MPPFNAPRPLPRPLASLDAALLDAVHGGTGEDDAYLDAGSYEAADYAEPSYEAADYAEPSYDYAEPSYEAADYAEPSYDYAEPSYEAASFDDSFGLAGDGASYEAPADVFFADPAAETFDGGGDVFAEASSFAETSSFADAEAFDAGAEAFDAGASEDLFAGGFGEASLVDTSDGVVTTAFDPGAGLDEGATSFYEGANPVHSVEGATLNADTAYQHLQSAEQAFQAAGDEASSFTNSLSRWWHGEPTSADMRFDSMREGLERAQQDMADRQGDLMRAQNAEAFETGAPVGPVPDFTTESFGTGAPEVSYPNYYFDPSLELKGQVGPFFGSVNASSEGLGYDYGMGESVSLGKIGPVGFDVGYGVNAEGVYVSPSASAFGVDVGPDGVSTSSPEFGIGIPGLSVSGSASLGVTYGEPPAGRR